MGKPALDGNEAKIREAQDRANGVDGLEWHISKETVSVFRSLAEFATPPPPAVLWRTADAPPNLIGCIVWGASIPVFTDDAMPFFMCQLVGENFEATLELRPISMKSGRIWQ